MASAKTSSGLGLVQHATTLRLTRIGTLVVGSLVFLYACEVSRKSDLSDVWPQVVIAAGLALTGLVTAWFEVRAAEHAATRARTEIRGFLIESDGLSVRARITRSGDLVFHGHDSDAYPAYEWDWAFRSSSFPAIRAALGGSRGDLLELLERTVPHWDRQDRYDPGSWLHNQGIPAAFRERGDTSNRTTRVLPIINPEHPPAQPHSDDAQHAAPSRNATRARELSNPRVPPHSRNSEPPDQDRPERSRRRRAEPSHEQAPADAHRRPAPNPHRSEPQSDSWHEQPAARDDEPPRRRNQPPNTYRNEPPSERRDEPPATRHSRSPNGYEPSEARGYEPPAARYDEPPTDHRSRGTRTGDPGPAGRRAQPPTAHRPALSAAHSESPWPHQPQSPAPRRNDPPNTRQRR
ncbi:hypothetical protein OG874_24080 [Nocardia sp. NBC_00565]|uniref:hypothetical protein n=1 Tax=Nocardia sp. NBC_00565 TaxID=2975993 RepID=UPI002E81F110|nr:hypothetical protein [Nocardia sp. NBC_00565]WUB99991.1 hypothetical protein OG874_24080 [Nocardia sp. NBC_00565]